MVRRTIDQDRVRRRFNSMQEVYAEENLPAWGYEVELNGFPLHFFYQWKNSPITFVSFAGGLLKDTTTVPRWSGHGLASKAGMNLLLISDPSFILSDQLRFGWYAGNSHQENLQDKIVELVERLSRGTKLVFFGISAGGFAALHTASKFEHSNVVVINSSTDILKSKPLRIMQYASLAWNFNPLEQILEFPCTTSVLHEYSSPTSNNVMYIQNSGDKLWFNDHYLPFKNSVNPQSNIIFREPFLSNSHQAPELETMKSIVELARDNFEAESFRAAATSIKIQPRKDSLDTST